MQDLSHLSIYRHLAAEPKRAEEARTLMPFLMKVQQFIPLEDVEYGQDPPDFVFRHAGGRVAVELTDVVPKVFGVGGYARKAAHKQWKSSTKENPQPRHEFDWGEFTVRESLAAIAAQIDGKSQKAKKWRTAFPENWLLMHVGSGSPFGLLLAGERKDAKGCDGEVNECKAKMGHELSLICQRPHPFAHVILFSGLVLLAFPASGRNPCSFPVLSKDVLALGAAASDKYLDWRSALQSIVEHPLLPPGATSGAISV